MQEAESTENVPSRSIEQINSDYQSTAMNLGHQTFQQVLLHAQIEDSKQKMLKLGLEADKLKAEAKEKEEATVQ